MLVHHVYFTLKDGTAENCQALVDACQKYLTDHAGAVFFSAGTLTTDLDRPVNDQDFDVALSVVFESRAAHDAYQVAERHLQFIAENKASWKQVRVFDSDA
jgi:hypothetical protein